MGAEESYVDPAEMTSFVRRTHAVADRFETMRAGTGVGRMSFGPLPASLQLWDVYQQVAEDLADGFDQMAQILVEAANACVEAFNLLCEIIFEFILWYLAELIIAAVAAAVSFGASAVAFAVRALLEPLPERGRDGH
ncbi:hypothetical protein [Dactylosporangium sp. NPDC005555]|uniref:hypothetical protein n=1 Tax=Dactylosporangium sp. NPDC005555 TaxID=3154889 RepID=UPI0033A43951